MKRTYVIISGLLLLFILVMVSGNRTSDESIIVAETGDAGKTAEIEAPEPGIQSLTFKTDDGVRHYKRFIPSGGAKSRPVALYLHGGGQGFGVLTNSERGEQLQMIAEREQIVLLVPNGTDIETGSFYDPEDERGGILNRQRWNDDRPESIDTIDAIDDVTFLSDLVAFTHETLQTDENKTYIFGPSNGGAMTAKILQERPDMFAAGAVFVMTIPTAYTFRGFREPIPILLWVGTEDKLVQYQGIPGLLSAQEATLWWAERNGHTGSREMVRVSEPDTEGCYTSVQRYEGEYPVYTYVTHGGGHILPSIEYRVKGLFLAENIIGKQCADIEALEEVWQFLSQYERTDT